MLGPAGSFPADKERWIEGKMDVCTQSCVLGPFSEWQLRLCQKNLVQNELERD